MGPGDRSHNGANLPIRHRQAMEGDRQWLGWRGTGTHVVRMVLAGRTCPDGGKNFHCVYVELDPHSMRGWMGRQSFYRPQAMEPPGVSRLDHCNGRARRRIEWS